MQGRGGRQGRAGRAVPSTGGGVPRGRRVGGREGPCCNAIRASGMHLYASWTVRLLTWCAGGGGAAQGGRGGGGAAGAAQAGGRHAAAPGPHPRGRLSGAAALAGLLFKMNHEQCCNVRKAPLASRGGRLHWTPLGRCRPACRLLGSSLRSAPCAACCSGGSGPRPSLPQRPAHQPSARLHFPEAAPRPHRRRPCAPHRCWSPLGGPQPARRMQQPRHFHPRWFPALFGRPAPPPRLPGPRDCRPAGAAPR